MKLSGLERPHRKKSTTGSRKWKNKTEQKKNSKKPTASSTMTPLVE
jgi:hypothetical protein